MAENTQVPEGLIEEQLQPEQTQGVPKGLIEEKLQPAASEEAPATATEATAETPKEAPEGTAAKAWRKATTPLLSQPTIEKNATEYANKPVTLAETEHPYLTPLKKFGAGIVGSTEKMARDFSSPLGLATMAAGPIIEGAAKAAPALGELAESVPYLKPALQYGQRALGAAFGTQGAVEAGKGVTQAYKEGGFTPETAEQTLGGAGIAAMGGAGALEGTKAGTEPAMKDAHQKILEDRVKKAEKEHTPAKDLYDAHAAIRATGEPAPSDVLKKYETTRGALESAKAALQAHIEAKAATPSAPDQPITPAEVEAARPEQPTPTKEENDAKLMGMMNKIAPAEGAPAQNVKTPGQIPPETFPQEPKIGRAACRERV